MPEASFQCTRSQSKTEEAVERRSIIGCTVFSIFFVNWAPLKCDGAPVSGCNAETRCRWHMIDSEEFKRVFYALIIMLRVESHPCQSPYIPRVHELLRRPSCHFQCLPQCAVTHVHGYRRSNSSSPAVTADAAGHEQHSQRSGQPTVNQCDWCGGFLRRPPTLYPLWRGCVRSRRSFHRGPIMYKIAQSDTMMRRPCARVPWTDVS